MYTASRQLRREDDGRGIWPAPKKPHLLLSETDALLAILEQLPFSMLLRLRSVCRSWREHLSSYEFWLLWFKRNSNPNLRLQSAPNTHQNQNQKLQTIANPQQVSANPQQVAANFESNSPDNLFHNSEPYPTQNNGGSNSVFVPHNQNVICNCGNPNCNLRQWSNLHHNQNQKLQTIVKFHQLIDNPQQVSANLQQVAANFESNSPDSLVHNSPYLIQNNGSSNQNFDSNPNLRDSHNPYFPNHDNPQNSNSNVNYLIQNSNPNHIYQDVHFHVMPNPNLIHVPNPHLHCNNCNVIQTAIAYPYPMQNAVAHPVNNSMIHPNPIQHNPNPLPFLNLKTHQDLDRIISNFNPNPNGPPIPRLLLCSVQFKASPGCQAAPHSVCYVLQQNAASKRSFWSRLHKSFMQVQGPYSILACDGGLLLLAMCVESLQQLIVCNPFLKAKKVLPSPIFPLPLYLSATSTGFIVDEKRGEYRVVLSGLDWQVYHSSTGKWQVIRKTCFEDPLTASPPMLDGSIFWLSSPKGRRSYLYVYHPREEVLTCVLTRFPRRVSLSNHGHVWKDAESLQTLAGSSTWFGTWKFDNGRWKRGKMISNIDKNQFLCDLDYVKVDNLLFFRVSRFNQVLIFDYGRNNTCVALCCTYNLERLTGHCVFQPSCVRV